MGRHQHEKRLEVDLPSCQSAPDETVMETSSIIKKTRRKANFRSLPSCEVPHASPFWVGTSYDASQAAGPRMSIAG